jgi:diacylglycerol kinase
VSDLADLLHTTALDWNSFKLFLERGSAIDNDAIHVLVGGLGVLLVAFITRRSVAEWVPWLVILAVALVNEAIDLSVEQWPDLAVQYGESAKDIVLTMVFPTTFMIVSRLQPQLWTRRE